MGDSEDFRESYYLDTLKETDHVAQMKEATTRINSLIALNGPDCHVDVKETVTNFLFVAQQMCHLDNPAVKLNLGDLNLKEMPEIPSCCKYIVCSDLLKYMPTTQCVKIDCRECFFLDTIAEQPNCVSLECSCSESIQNLLGLPNCKYLSCYGNSIVSLPDLPKCIILTCDENALTSLPELPNCVELSCWNNELRSLPELPECVKLGCTGNCLVYLPRLPKCKWLNCDRNKYLHINKRQAKRFRLKETPNYNRCAITIQRNYRNYLRKKYYDTVSQYMPIGGLGKLICLYTV